MNTELFPSDHEVWVIAEAGMCMEGSTDLAITMAQAARDAGAWGFKVQLLRPEQIATVQAPKYWSDTFGTRSQREAFQLAGIVDYHRWKEVKAACDEFGIEFLATPFDLDAVEALEDLGVAYYKVASGDITHRPLLECLGRTGKPVFLSTGASTLNEMRAAIGWLGHGDVVPLACNLAYPTAIADANLGRISRLIHEGYHVVGYSDHTTVTRTAIAATALGARVLEKHYTYSKDGDNVPDHAMAVDAAGLEKYVRQAWDGALLRGSDSLGVSGGERAAHHGARRSIYAARDLPAGHRLEMEDLAFLRPGGGTPPSLYGELLGHVLHHAVWAGEPL